MNPANALGFLGIGLSMLLLPLIAPGWFPHTAVDGSSTRALWTQIMGVVQCGLGVAFLAQHASAVVTEWARAVLGRGAVSTADWQTKSAPTGVLAIDLTPRPAALRARAVRRRHPHPIAAAVFRRHPQSSFVHLVEPHLGSAPTPDGTPAPQQRLVELLEREAGVSA